MSVLVKDNSVLKSIGGEVYKQPPIIDISSTYGVTKDGSNLVSSVKNKYQPNKFRPLVGTEPIENGNGFEFTGNDVLFGAIREIPIQNESFCFEFWVKVNSIAANGSTFFQLGTADGEFWMRYRTTEKLQMLVGSVSLDNNIAVFTLGQWYHVFIDYRKAIDLGVTKARGVYIDGVLKRRTVADTQLNFTLFNSKFSIGNFGRLYDVARGLNGAISGFQFHKKSVFNSETYSEEQQVFTPPTYPNTIL